MRLFGILLIVANLIAAGAYVYLATQDWKGRQTITASGLRHILVLQGLPLDGKDFSADDETPFVMEMGGGESTKTISRKLLESYFQTQLAAAAPAPIPAGPDGPAAAAPVVSLTAGAPVVTNQLAEVRRVQALIKAELDKAADPRAKVALLKGWLINQAETYDTRTLYLDLTSPNEANGQPKSNERVKADADKLAAALEARFATVLTGYDKDRAIQPVNVPDPKTLADELAAMRDRKAPDDPAEAAKRDAALKAKRDELAKVSTDGRELITLSSEQRAAGALDDTERRNRLAHLLVFLDPDAAWQKRVSVIVGLRRFVKVITFQVLALKDMLDAVELGIPTDQATFVKQESLLREKAIQNSERARVIAEERAKLVEQKIATDAAVTRWRTQLKELEAHLAKLKAEVGEMLVAQSRIEKQLYEIQREVGLTLEEVYRLEDLLAATERERYGLPTK
jgi:hypothetical protein